MSIQHIRVKKLNKSQEKMNHLAIIDVNLPDGDGFQFCKWLKAKKQVSRFIRFCKRLRRRCFKWI